MFSLTFYPRFFGLLKEMIETGYSWEKRWDTWFNLLRRTSWKKDVGNTPRSKVWRKLRSCPLWPPPYCLSNGGQAVMKFKTKGRDQTVLVCERSQESIDETRKKGLKNRRKSPSLSYFMWMKWHCETNYRL